MKPTNTQKITYIRRYFAKRLEMAGKATEGPWKNEEGWVGCNNASQCVVNAYHYNAENDGAFIAAARTDCPMTMEMVIEMIDWAFEVDEVNSVYMDKIISRFENTHGEITQEQVEAL